MCKENQDISNWYSHNNEHSLKMKFIFRPKDIFIWACYCQLKSIQQVNSQVRNRELAQGMVHGMHPHYPNNSTGTSVNLSAETADSNHYLVPFHTQVIVSHK